MSVVRMPSVSSYSSAADESWTRASLLAALLENAVVRLELAQGHQVAAGISPGDRPADTDDWENLKRIQELLLVIIDGLRPEQDPTAGKVHALCVYAFGEAMGYHYQNALVALRPLAEAFRAIVPEADKLERQGKIPAIQPIVVLDASA